MTELCDLCRHDALEPFYRPERSTRDITVCLCRHCGLIQSTPRADRAPRRAAAVSSGADWGNVRYGKGFRTKEAMNALSRHIDLAQDFEILDVGSNRGSFAKALLAAAPNAFLTAIEPDERVSESCAGLSRTELTLARIEDVPLESGRFDVIHSCHTIEHLAHPMAVLEDHWRALKPNGLLIIDAPNSAILGADDIVEEWFIDKHLYHFSKRTLTRMIEAAGFVIVEGPDDRDNTNLLIVARRIDNKIAHIAADPLEVAAAEGLLIAYQQTRAANLMALTAVAAEIGTLLPKRVAMWGAGRLFDSLVVHGGFKASRLAMLIDAHLKAHVGERHGCALSAPDDLPEAEPGVVVVMSRGFAGEIAAHAKQLAPKAEVIFYSDLLARARTRMAA
ncbi:MAG TPA: class I SAM-dependent methyltransferase [Rhizomicrobium sp.]|jgi:2-polyprenyl-3-methyl-5-hydroxy-6-metoxy-1,4-benzoquinol methylase